MAFHNYRGQASTNALRRRRGDKFTQADTRHSAVCYDQFGRKWSYEQDNKTGMPVSPLQALFSAPWLPDQGTEFLRVNPDNTSECYIDHPAIYRHRVVRLREYHRDVTAYCTRKKLPVPAMGDYDDEIVAAVGQPPRALELVAASAQENPWVLGFSDEPDPRLVRFLERTSHEIEEAMEVFDFGADSYAEAVGAVADGRPARARKREFRTFTNFKDLAALEEAAGVTGDDALSRQNGDATEDGVDLAGAFAELGALEASGDGFQLADEPEQEAPEEPPSDLAEQAEEDFDAEALGGRTIDPKKSAIAAKQAPRRPTQTAIPRKRGKAQSAGVTAFDRAKRPSVADGAKPYIPPITE